LSIAGQHWSATQAHVLSQYEWRRSLAGVF
jgi:hypothetical protein